MKLRTVPFGRHLRAAFLIILSLSLSGEMLGGEEQVPAALQEAGARAYKALKQRDMDSLVSMLSGDRFFG
jgi:hypothetical protein